MANFYSLVLLLSIIPLVRGQCTQINGATLPATFSDTYTCCYRFQNPATPNFTLPAPLSGDTNLNGANPIVLANGSAITQGCNGDILYYETTPGTYTEYYTGADNNAYQGINNIYATNGNKINARTIQTYQSNLASVLGGRRGLLFINCNNGVYSCIRMNFTATQTGGSSYNIDPTSVGFNGTNTSCAAGTNQYYLQNVNGLQSVTAPNVTMFFNSSTNRIDIITTSWYIPSFVTHVIRFSPFNYSTDDINLPGTCENRLASTFTGKNFSQWWGHLPNAAQPGALGNVSWPAYGPTGPYWSISALDCARIIERASFSLNTLGGCKSPQGVSEITVQDYSTTQGVIIYSGSLYITGVLALFTGYGTGNKAGYSTTIWQYPFKFTFQSSSTATAQVAGGGNFFTVQVISTSIIPSGPNTGFMQLVLNTTYFSQKCGYAGNASLISSTGTTVSLVLTSPVGIIPTPSIQTWTWLSTTKLPSYNGVYIFSWTGNDCSDCANSSSCKVGNTFNASILILLSNQTQVDSKNSFGSSITIYKDSTFSTPQSSVFTAGLPVCFMDTLSVALEDAYSFKVTLMNAFLCSPNNQSGGLIYDGVTTFGCRNVTNSVRLVSNNSVSASDVGVSVVSFYNPTMYNLARPIDTGLCITAQPNLLLPDNSFATGVYTQYMQMELLVQTYNMTSTSVAFFDANTGATLRQYPTHYVQKPQREHQNRATQPKSAAVYNPTDDEDTAAPSDSANDRVTTTGDSGSPSPPSSSTTTGNPTFVENSQNDDIPVSQNTARRGGTSVASNSFTVAPYSTPVTTGIPVNPSTTGKPWHHDPHNDCRGCCDNDDDDDDRGHNGGGRDDDDDQGGCTQKRSMFDWLLIFVCGLVAGGFFVALITYQKRTEEERLMGIHAD